MKYVVYIDVFFAVNFFMDLYILVIAAKIDKPQTTKKRYIFSAMIGAALSCIVLLMRNKYAVIQKIITYLLIPFIMCICAFGRKRKIKSFMILYVVTFVSSGVIEIFYNLFFSRLKPVMQRFVATAFISYFATDIIMHKYMEYMKGRQSGNDLYDVMVYAFGKEISLKALYDSGNSLTEPISGMNVHIINKSEADKLLEGVDVYKISYRVVPFNSIGKKGIIPAVLVDNVLVFAGKEEINTGRAFVGIYDGNVANESNYKMILNRSIKEWL